MIASSQMPLFLALSLPSLEVKLGKLQTITFNLGDTMQFDHNAVHNSLLHARTSYNILARSIPLYANGSWTALARKAGSRLLAQHLQTTELLAEYSHTCGIFCSSSTHRMKIFWYFQR
jgi:hypothetical protein